MDQNPAGIVAGRYERTLAEISRENPELQVESLDYARLKIKARHDSFDSVGGSQLSTFSVDMGKDRMLVEVSRDSANEQTKAPMPSQIEVLTAGQLEEAIADMPDAS